MSNIFISHSYEENEFARKLANYLRRDGADVWIHYTQLVVESNLPKAIRKAIAWSDVVVLVWSNSAACSSCIQLELYSAMMFKKTIIICQTDATKKWDNLEGFQQINFADFDQGYFDLVESLHIVLSDDVLEYLHHSFQRTPQENHELENSFETVNFADEEGSRNDTRNETVEILTVNEYESRTMNMYRDAPKQLCDEDVAAMIARHKFFDKKKNENGHDIVKTFEFREINGEKVIFDSDSGLMWQKSGSLRSMWLETAKQWIEELNRISYAGHNDWRLPTLEEAMSLMKKERLNGDMHIDLMFDKNQTSIWTSDMTTAGSRAWVVFFNYGSCYANCFDFNNFVRAVRS
ncbi:MAG TPA: DUF1566 domain-containing protein [bacterium]